MKHINTFKPCKAQPRPKQKHSPRRAPNEIPRHIAIAEAKKAREREASRRARIVYYPPTSVNVW